MGGKHKKNQKGKPKESKKTKKSTNKSVQFTVYNKLVTECEST